MGGNFIDISNKLRFFRLHIGYNQKEMAEMLGLKQPTYSSIESGKTQLTTENLKKLHDLFGLNPSWYLIDQGEMIVERADPQHTDATTVADLAQNPPELDKHDPEQLRRLLSEKERLLLETKIVIELLSEKIQSLSHNPPNT